MIVQKHSRLPRKYERQGQLEQPAQESTTIAPGSPLSNADPTEILKRYLNEETSLQIANSYGVTRAALSYFLLKHAEEQYKDAQIVRAVKRKEEAEERLELAADPLELARAREMLKAAQWDLERVCKRIYGEDRANLGITVTPNLTIIVAGEQHAAPHSAVEGVVVEEQDT